MLLAGCPWTVELVKVETALFLIFKAVVDAVNISVILRNGQGRGRGRSRGGCWARTSVQKNLAVDNVGSNALLLFLLLLPNSKHQSVGVANPSDKIDKTAFNLLEM